LNSEALAVTNSTGADVMLNTFHSAGDWATNYDQDTLNAEIWNHPRSLIKPFALHPPKIEDVNADAVIAISSFDLKKHALEAAWLTICTKIFQQICPNIIEDPA
jgi:hypothetical protein